MNMCPKISVIVPIYNAEQYLGVCIDSVLKQTLRDIELLLIDDGSTDNSLKICEKYSKTDSRIRLYANKNIGQGLERNFGIEKAIGDYVAFLDADDQYQEDMLERLYQKASETHADMVSCGYADLYAGHIIKEHPLCPVLLDNQKEIKEAMADLIAYEDKDGYSGCIAVWDSIFKRNLIMSCHVKFLSEREVYSEDLLFKLTFMSYAKKIVFCGDILYTYRINDTSFTNEISDKVLNRIVSLYDVINLKFENELGAYNLKKRMTSRAFFSLRFNIKKAARSQKSSKFYKKILGNRRLMAIVKRYHPTDLKNFVLYYCIRWRMLWLLSLKKLLKEND